DHIHYIHFSPTRRSSDLPPELREARRASTQAHGRTTRAPGIGAQGDGVDRLRPRRGGKAPASVLPALPRRLSSRQEEAAIPRAEDRKSTRLNSSHVKISH